MSIAVKRAYNIYLRFEVFGGGLRCKIFADVFPKLPADDSFEYEEMRNAYKPEEFANSYLRPEVIEHEMNDPFKREEYLRLLEYVQGGMPHD